LVSLTGGICESIDIRDTILDNRKTYLWDLVRHAKKYNSLMGAIIAANNHDQKGTRQENGLFVGQPYFIIRVALVELQGKSYHLLRLLNPCPSDDKIEWTGAWSDDSHEWDLMNEEIKSAFEHKSLPEGEFWMDFSDFSKNFYLLDLCHVTPAAYLEQFEFSKDSVGWSLISFYGEWTPGSTAGGCGQNNEALFWTNPQILISLNLTKNGENGLDEDAEKENDEKKLELLLSFMQMNMEEKRAERFGRNGEEFIQFRLYRVINDEDAEHARKTGGRLYARQLEKCSTSNVYLSSREIVKRFRLASGNYVLVLSCYDANRKCEFLVRALSEQNLHKDDFKMLKQHKEHLVSEDIFYFQTNEAKPKMEEITNVKRLNRSRSDTPDAKSNPIMIFKPILSPIFEKFDKVKYAPEQETGIASACSIM